MARNVLIPTSLDPDEDQILKDLGEKSARWIYGALWLRLRHALANKEGPLYEALRAEVDLMVAEVTERTEKAINRARTREDFDRSAPLLEEKFTLIEFQMWLAPEVPLPELVEDEEPL